MAPRPVSPIDAADDPVQNTREQRAGIERPTAREDPPTGTAGYRRLTPEHPHLIGVAPPRV